MYVLYIYSPTPTHRKTPHGPRSTDLVVAPSELPTTLGRGCGITHCCCFLIDVVVVVVVFVNVALAASCWQLCKLLLLHSSPVRHIINMPTYTHTQTHTSVYTLETSPAAAASAAHQANPALLKFQFTSKITSKFSIPFINRWQMLVLVLL